MSRLVARILLTILMLPLAALVYPLVLMMWESTTRHSGIFDRTRITLGFLGSGFAAWIFIIVYWTALWWKSTNWNSARITQTILAGGGAILAGCAAGAIIASGSEQEVGVFFGTIVTPILWLVATVFIWRETDEERIARLRGVNTDVLVCPTCGYNLTGLREARCPECGAQYTLNELLAAQPHRAAAELEST